MGNHNAKRITDRILSWIKILTLTALTAFLMVLTFWVYRSMQLIQTTNAVEVQAQQTLIHLNSTVDNINTIVPKINGLVGQLTTASSNLNQTILFINRPCKAKDRNGKKLAPGTLCDIDKTLDTFRLTAGEILIAAHHEDQNLGTIDTQEAALFAITHKILESANTELTDLHTTTSSLNTLVAGLSKNADNIESMTTSGKSILADGAYEAHKLTHPTKKTGFWVGFWFVVEKLKPPLF